MNNIFKKLIRDYTHQTETLVDVQDISADAESHFREAMVDYNNEALKALAPKSEGEAPKIEDAPSVKFEDKHFKKIFRKIAIKCHPDKLDDSYSEREIKFLKKCYENINEANNSYDWGLLLKTALELDIEIDELSKEAFQNISENTDKIKNKISKYEESMAYTWYMMSDPNMKNAYLDSCSKIFMKMISGEDN